MDAGILSAGLEKVLKQKMSQETLTSWFVWQEIKMNERLAAAKRGLNPDSPETQTDVFLECVRKMPLSIPEGSAFAGSQDDAFSPSYALINPSFRVETFAGYCDPLAIYDDMELSEEFPKERVEKVRSYFAETSYVKELKKVYEKAGNAAKEAAFFIEPVTGHVIPDMTETIRLGIEKFISGKKDKTDYSKVMKKAASAPLILAERYAGLADKLATERRTDADEVSRLRKIAEICRKVPRKSVDTLQEAMQSYILQWQTMCLEQGPNPYAFSAGNLDRLFFPYLKDTDFESAVALFRHFLAFLMAGRRCWAISQNIIVGGKDADGKDLTNDMTYVMLEAFYRSNYPQPILSVKLHGGTPDKVHDALGKFFFTPGHSTPSLFNDDSMFKVLEKKGVEKQDIPGYAIAGCQEPLIAGKENGNTTNSWLNLPKILELTLNDGRSMITGDKLGLSWTEAGYKGLDEVCGSLEEAYWRQFDFILGKMVSGANGCTECLSRLASPFSSVIMGCLDSGRDMRDAKNPGTKYSGSGCLVHGVSVLSDSLGAAERFIKNGIDSPENLLAALKADFKGYEKIRSFLLAQPKYGNAGPEDARTARLGAEVCRKISEKRNSAGARFNPDFSTPSTHLLYGHWVGATPDGRNARSMLGYGVDPRPGAAAAGFNSRLLSLKKLDFSRFSGGYASHIGVDPAQFSGAASFEEKARLLKKDVINPLFSFGGKKRAGKESCAPFYVYFNIDSEPHLRAVLANPRRHAPNGVYIIRIHGTFVNFLDLSPAIQQDIMERLDPESAKLEKV